MPAPLEIGPSESGSSTVGSDPLRDLRDRHGHLLVTGLSWAIAILSLFTVGLAVAYYRQGLQLKQATALQSKRSSAVPPLSTLSCPNYSPTFPSQGGPDCTYPCPNGTRSVGTAFFNPFPATYAEKVLEAGRIVKSIDSRNTIYVEGTGPNAFMDSHISFSYYCCHTEDEISRLRAVLGAWNGWRPHSVRLSRVTCAIDGPALDHVSFIIMLDRESNRRMMAWVAELEAHIRAAGLPVNLPRRHQEPYHTTLAVVNGSGYPVARAIEELNARFPASSWLEQPIALTRPCNAHGGTPEGFFC